MDLLSTKNAPKINIHISDKIYEVWGMSSIEAQTQVLWEPLDFSLKTAVFIYSRILHYKFLKNRLCSVDNQDGYFQLKCLPNWERGSFIYMLHLGWFSEY